MNILVLTSAHSADEARAFGSDRTPNSPASSSALLVFRGFFSRGFFGRGFFSRGFFGHASLGALLLPAPLRPGSASAANASASTEPSASDSSLTGALRWRLLPVPSASAAATASPPSRAGKVIIDRNTDFFHRFRANAFNRFQLLGRHVGQRFHRIHARRLQFLDQPFAQSR